MMSSIDPLKNKADPRCSRSSNSSGFPFNTSRFIHFQIRKSIVGKRVKKTKIRFIFHSGQPLRDEDIRNFVAMTST
jgi:hypothetical protein